MELCILVRFIDWANRNFTESHISDLQQQIHQYDICGIRLSTLIDYSYNDKVIYIFYISYITMFLYILFTMCSLRKLKGYVSLNSTEIKYLGRISSTNNDLYVNITNIEF